MTDADNVVRMQVKTLQIVVASLAMGLGMFAAVVLTMEAPQQQQPNSQLSLMMAGFAGTILLVRIIIPGVLFRVTRHKIAQCTWLPGGPPGDAGKLMMALQAKTIIGCALLEGAGFANLFAYMQERQWYSLAIAGLMGLGILLTFPLRGAVDAWLADQLRWLHDERTLRRSER